MKNIKILLCLMILLFLSSFVLGKESIKINDKINFELETQKETKTDKMSFDITPSKKVQRTYYENVKENIDIEYIKTNKILKENIILKQPIEQNFINFTININSDYIIYNGEIHVFERQGINIKKIGKFYRPYYEFNDTVYYLNFTYHNSIYSLDITEINKINPEYYPIIIDPTFEDIQSNTSIYWAVIQAENVTESSFELNNCLLDKIGVNRWVIYEPVSDNYEVSRAKVMQTLFYGINGLPTLLNTTNLLKLFTLDERDVGKRGIFSYSKCADANNFVDTSLLVNYSINNEANDNDNVSFWSITSSGSEGASSWSSSFYIESILANSGTSSEFGTNTTEDIRNNPVYYQAQTNANSQNDYGFYNSDVSILTLSKYNVTSTVVSFTGSGAYTLSSYDSYDNYSIPLFELYEISNISLSNVNLIPDETPPSVFTNLKGYCNVTYINESFYANIDYQIYKNDNLFLNGTYIGSNSGANTNIVNISYLNTTFNDEFSLSCLGWYDTRVINTSWENSSVITIEPFYIDNCSNPQNISTNRSFTITTKDEKTNNLINTNGTFLFNYYSNDSIEYIYSNNINNNNNFSFCVYPDYIFLNGDIITNFVSNGYNPYIFNRFNITFNETNYYAYLLQESADHPQISYKVIDVNNEPIENALFRIFRIIEGVSTLIFEEKTDITGQVNHYQDTTYKYDYTITVEGYPLKSFTLKPVEQTSEPDYTIKITAEDTSYFDNSYSGIRYKHVPETIMFNNSGQFFNLSFIVEGSNLEEIGIKFYDHNFTCIPASCEQILYSNTGGTVTISINMNQVGTLTGAYWFKPIGKEKIYVNDNKIKVVNFIEGAGKTLTELMQDIKENTSSNFRTILAAGISVIVIGLGASLGLFGAALIIPAVLANIFLSLPQIGLINPFVGMIMSIFGIVMFVLFSMGRNV